MKMGGGVSRNVLRLVFVGSFAAVGCSGGEWFPTVEGPPKGDERLYYSPYNHVDTRSRAERDAADAALREQNRRQDHRDDARDSK